jgi:hypothetical protein
VFISTKAFLVDEEAMQPDPSQVLFGGDGRLAQRTGGLISLVVSVPILTILIFMVLGCMGKANIRFKSPGQVQKTKTTSFIHKIVIVSPLTSIHFVCCLTGLTSTVLDAVRKVGNEFQSSEQTLCDGLTISFVLFYVVSKFCTYCFLGLRAKKVYASDYVFKQRLITIIAVVFPLAFLTLGVLTSFHTIGLIFRGNCEVVVNTAWLTEAFPGIDLGISLIYFGMFLIPLRALGKLKDTNVTSPTRTIRKPPSQTFKDLVKETTRLSIIQMIASGLSIGMIVFGFLNLGAFGLFTASFGSVDILANCLVQMYSTRRAWSVKFNGKVINFGELEEGKESPALFTAGSDNQQRQSAQPSHSRLRSTIKPMVELEQNMDSTFKFSRDLVKEENLQIMAEFDSGGQTAVPDNQIPLLP